MRIDRPAPIRPPRTSVRHTSCTALAKHRVMWLSDGTALQLAVDPSSIAELRCTGCATSAPVAEFTWLDGQRVGS